MNRKAVSGTILILFLATTAFSVIQIRGLSPPAGLVGWWPGDGNTNDIANGNDGTLLSGASFDTGVIDQAFSFDGVDDCVQILDDGPVDLDGFSQLTIDAWIYPNVVVGEGKTIVSKYDSRSISFPDGVSYGLSVQDGKLRMVIYESTFPSKRAYIMSDDPVIIPEAWTHVAGVWKGNVQFELYVNGMPVNGTITTHGVVDDLYMANNDVPVNIGRVESIQKPEQTPSHHFDGLIDEVEIFDRALTQSEIQELYARASTSPLWGEHEITVVYYAAYIYDDHDGLLAGDGEWYFRLAGAGMGWTSYSYRHTDEGSVDFTDRQQSWDISGRTYYYCEAREEDEDILGNVWWDYTSSAYISVEWPWPTVNTWHHIHEISGDVSHSSRYFIQNEAPTADPIAIPDTVYAGVELSLSSSAYDPEGDSISYEWDFSYDGLSFNAESTEQNPTWVYSDPGTYVVAFRVKDYFGTYGAMQSIPLTAFPYYEERVSVLEEWHNTWNGVIESMSDWWNEWHSEVEDVVDWMPDAQEQISALEDKTEELQEELDATKAELDATKEELDAAKAEIDTLKEAMKYITVNVVIRENTTLVEKNYTIVELDYVKSLKGSEFNAVSFRVYLNKLLDDAVVIAVNYWQRGYTGELVTG